VYGPVRTVVSQGQRVTAYLCKFDVDLKSNPYCADCAMCDYCKCVHLTQAPRQLSSVRVPSIFPQHPDFLSY